MVYESKKIFFLFLLPALCLCSCNTFDKKATDQYEAATKRWNNGEYQLAARMYLGLVKDHPFSARADDALYWVGVTQFLYLGQTDQALETLGLLLKRYPHRDMAPQAQWYIAQIMELGFSDYDKATGEYRKAAEYSTNREVREKSLYSLADCLFRVGKIEEAREIWTLQTKEFPAGPQANLGYFRLGTTAFSKGELEAATVFIEKRLKTTTTINWW